MSKRTFLILCVLVFGSIFFPNYLQAQEKIAKEELFEAKVIQIFETSKIIEENGNIHPYQRLKLLGTSGSFKDKNLEIESGARDQPGVQTYKVGDLVVVNKSLDYQGNIQLRITDFVRRAPIYLLAGLFLPPGVPAFDMLVTRPSWS